jgi:hypothetical protein
MPTLLICSQENHELDLIVGSISAIEASCTIETGKKNAG